MQDLGWLLFARSFDWSLGSVAATCWFCCFFLIGQIHTLSTPAALGHLQDLVTEPVQPWDALICSSRAGRDAVEQVLGYS